MALISNIGLLTAEELTGEPNEKEPTFNKEHSPGNYEVENILIGDFCIKPTSTPRKAVLEKEGIIGALVHLIVIVHNPQWRHNPVRNIQLMFWVDLHLMLVLVTVNVVWCLVPPTLPLRKLIVRLMAVIFCDLRLGYIHPLIIHTKKGTILNNTFGEIIVVLLLVMVEVVLVLGQPTSTPKYIIFLETDMVGFSEILESAHSTPHGVIHD